MGENPASFFVSFTSLVQSVKQVNQSVLKQNVTTNKHLAAVIRQRVILLAIRAIHMLLMIADMILSMMMEIMTGTDIRKIRTMLMV